MFELSWFHFYCNPNYTNTIMVLISKARTEWCWSIHTFEEQNCYALESSKLQIKVEFTETCPRAAWCPAGLSFQTGMDATLLKYMFLGVWAVTVTPVVFQCGAVSTFFFQLGSNVHCKYSLGRPVVSQCTRDKPVALCTLIQGKDRGNWSFDTVMQISFRHHRITRRLKGFYVDFYSE